jgi:predicted nicotinamide N-methyase
VWPGSYGLAQWIQHHPEEVRNARVLDVACGCGVVALASIKSGAAVAVANEIDPFALAATDLNFDLTLPQAAKDRLQFAFDDLVGQPLQRCFSPSSAGEPVRTLVFAGDVCYEQLLAEQMLRWLSALAREENTTVLVGDPGRHFFQRQHQGRELLMSVDLPSDLRDANFGITATGVFRILA